MKVYTVREAFEQLKTYKITTNEESVRRWLRQGVIKGIAPTTRKEGWQVPKKSLDDFLKERLPQGYKTNITKKSNTTRVAKGTKEEIRASMWRELAAKNIWEGYIEIKKSSVHACIQHRKHSKDLEKEVWQRCITNSQAYKKPRVSYLLEAFSFEGKRLLLDKNFVSLEEQAIFTIIEHVRISKVQKKEKKEKTPIKAPKGTEEFVLLKDIIVPEEFLNSRPNREKTQKVIDHVKKTGQVDEPITINKETMILSDGYRRYYVAKKMKMDKIPVSYEKAL